MIYVTDHTTIIFHWSLHWFWYKNSSPWFSKIEDGYQIATMVENVIVYVHPYSHRQVWTHREEATMKNNAYKKISSGNFLNVCICLTTSWITDRSNWWRIGITLIKRPDPRIVLPNRCQILRFMNKTLPQATMPTGLEHVSPYAPILNH